MTIWWLATQTVINFSMHFPLVLGDDLKSQLHDYPCLLHIGGAIHTVYKFQDFSVTLILCEINFEECRSSKKAVFETLGA